MCCRRRFAELFEATAILDLIQDDDINRNAISRER